MEDVGPSKSDVINLMRRLNMHDRIERAERELPEQVDLTRDGELLARLGLGIDILVNRLGGSST